MPVRRKAVLAAALAFALAAPALADTCKMSDCVAQLNGIALAPVVGMHDLEGGHWVFQLAPAYMTGTLGIDSAGGGITPQSGLTTGSERVEAIGGSFAVKRELSEHWGAAVLGTFVDQRGSPTLSGNSGLAPQTAINGTPGKAGFDGGSVHGIYQNMVAAAVTWDYFSKDGWFRLPISVGPAYFWEGFRFDNGFANPNNGAAQSESVKWSSSYPGMFVNVSLDFTIAGKIGITPGFAGFNSFKFGAALANYDYVVTQSGVAKSYPWQYYYNQNGGAPYVAVAYKPWGLSFDYVPPGSSGLALYSLTFTKKL